MIEFNRPHVPDQPLSRSALSTTQSLEIDTSNICPTTPPDDPPDIAPPAQLDPLTEIFLEALKFVSNIDAIPPQLTLKEYMGKLKVWDERTPTSPKSNMHLGHLKAYWADHTLQPNSTEADELEAARARILKGHLLLLN